MWRTQCHNSNWLQWEVHKTRCIWHIARSGERVTREGLRGAKLLPVLSSIGVFLRGPAHGTPRWSRGTRSVAPLPGSSEPHAPLLLTQTSGGTANGDGTCCLSVQPCVHVLRCVPRCAWSVPRPYTCVYVCVFRYALNCLSFLCMCRPGVWCHAVSACWCLCS